MGSTRQYDSAEEADKRLVVLNRGGPRPPLGLLAALAGTVHREPKQRAEGEGAAGERESDR